MADTVVNGEVVAPKFRCRWCGEFLFSKKEADAHIETANPKHFKGGLV